MEKFSLDDKVYDVITKYPDIVSVFKQLGFDQITNPVMLNSVGKVMTLRKAALSRKVSFEQLDETFRKSGYIIKEEEL